jgi:hypothetical protein
VERILDVAAGDHVSVILEIKDRSPDLAKLRRDLAAPLAQQGGGALSPAAWTGIATGAIAAGAITMTILTAMAQKDYDNERKHMTTTAQLASIRSDAKGKALAADITWGAAIVAGTVTTILLFTDTGPEKAPNEKDSKGIKLDIGAGSLRMRGQF